MAIEWGTREPPPPGPSAQAVIALVFVALLAALPTLGPRRPEPPPNAITATLQDELQQHLEVHYQTLRAGDRAGFLLTVDPFRGDLRRCLGERFDLVAEAGVRPEAPRILRIEQFRSTYIRAYVREGDGVARMYFRRAGALYNIARPPFEIWREVWRWYVSEPVAAELGPERRREVGGVPVVYRAIDEGIVDAVGDAASAARAFALLKRSVEAPRPFSVRIVPTRELARDARCQLTGGTLERPDGGVDVVVFETRFSSDLASAAGSTRETLRHEALHWLQHEVVRDLEVGEADWWLIEGYAHKESGTDRGRFPRDGCAATPPYSEMAAGPGSVLPVNQRASDLYAYAARMIDFLYERHGTEAYWSLLARSASPPPEGVVRAVLGVDAERFRSDFAAWARARYCR
ncbi:MAG TPA: hypothetical protein VFM93_04705 [Candidatus Limnocylindria bacterium]|nr:hypothetical protein [Candidatus Limnocylindria bacterium]